MHLSLKGLSSDPSRIEHCHLNGLPITDFVYSIYICLKWVQFIWLRMLLCMSGTCAGVAMLKSHLLHSHNCALHISTEDGVSGTRHHSVGQCS